MLKGPSRWAARRVAVLGVRRRSDERLNRYLCMAQGPSGYRRSSRRREPTTAKTKGAVVGTAGGSLLRTCDDAGGTFMAGSKCRMHEDNAGSKSSCAESTWNATFQAICLFPISRRIQSTVGKGRDISAQGQNSQSRRDMYKHHILRQISNQYLSISHFRLSSLLIAPSFCPSALFIRTY